MTNEHEMTDDKPEDGKKGWLSGKLKRAAATYARFESAKCKVVSFGAPLLLLLPGVGPIAAAGAGVIAGTMSKIYGMAADGLEGKDKMSADKFANVIIADAKDKLPGLLEQGGKGHIAKMIKPA